MKLFYRGKTVTAVYRTILVEAQTITTLCWWKIKATDRGGNRTDRRHLRKPVEFKMLLRPILLHVARYSEYISDRDTVPSAFVSKCALSLFEKRTTVRGVTMQAEKDYRYYRHKNKEKVKSSMGEVILPLQCKFFPI